VPGPGGGLAEGIGNGAGKLPPVAGVKLTGLWRPHFRRWPVVRIVTPSFNGSQCFGDTEAWALFGLRPSALAVDEWLGLEPGTTRYGAPPGEGRLVGVSGRFAGPTAAAVDAQVDELLALAGISARFLFPVAMRFPATWYAVSSCYFTAGDFASDPNGIQPTLGNCVSLNYWLVIRVLNWGCVDG
jgi:hypothetical protein